MLEEVVSEGQRFGSGGLDFSALNQLGTPGGVAWGSFGDAAMPIEYNAGDNQQVRDADEKDCAEQSGNPVVPTTGNKIDRVTDFSSSGEMPLILQRSYNHYWTYSGLFGRH